MRWTAIVLTLMALVLLSPSSSTGIEFKSSGTEIDHRYDHSRWVKNWNKRDRRIARALGAAAVIFRVNYPWLKACNNSEAGNNMVYNYQGSGAFGPMQFMHGTFYGHVGTAFVRARRNGHPVPYRFARWDSRVGQAITAAYMFSVGKSYHWTGRGC